MKGRLSDNNILLYGLSVGTPAWTVGQVYARPSLRIIGYARQEYWVGRPLLPDESGCSDPTA
jgi:hypothetical protein